MLTNKSKIGKQSLKKKSGAGPPHTVGKIINHKTKNY